MSCISTKSSSILLASWRFSPRLISDSIFLGLWNMNGGQPFRPSPDNSTINDREHEEMRKRQRHVSHWIIQSVILLEYAFKSRGGDDDDDDDDDDGAQKNHYHQRERNDYVPQARRSNERASNRAEFAGRKWMLTDVSDWRDMPRAGGGRGGAGMERNARVIPIT